jgi:cell division protein FtsL
MWLNGQLSNVVLLIVLLLCSLGVVTSQHKARKLFGTLQQEKDSARQMEVEWGQLQLERGTLAAPARVEKVALRQLKMQLPKSKQVQFVRIVSSSGQAIK